jgi:hypothetical protein
VSTTTVTVPLLDDALNPIVGGRVVVELGGDTGDGRGWRPVAATDSGGELVEPAEAYSDGSGLVTLHLTPNSELTPVNTVYRVTIRGRARQLFIVPVSATPVDLRTLYPSVVPLLPWDGVLNQPTGQRVYVGPVDPATVPQIDLTPGDLWIS